MDRHRSFEPSKSSSNPGDEGTSRLKPTSSKGPQHAKTRSSPGDKFPGLKDGVPAGQGTSTKPTSVQAPQSAASAGQSGSPKPHVIDLTDDDAPAGQVSSTNLTTNTNTTASVSAGQEHSLNLNPIDLTTYHTPAGRVSTPTLSTTSTSNNTTRPVSAGQGGLTNTNPTKFANDDSPAGQVDTPDLTENENITAFIPADQEHSSSHTSNNHSDGPTPVGQDNDENLMNQVLGALTDFSGLDDGGLSFLRSLGITEVEPANPGGSHNSTSNGTHAGDPTADQAAFTYPVANSSSTDDNDANDFGAHSGAHESVASSGHVAPLNTLVDPSPERDRSPDFADKTLDLFTQEWYDHDYLEHTPDAASGIGNAPKPDHWFTGPSAPNYIAAFRSDMFETQTLPDGTRVPIYYTHSYPSIEEDYDSIMADHSRGARVTVGTEPGDRDSDDNSSQGDSSDRYDGDDKVDTDVEESNLLPEESDDDYLPPSGVNPSRIRGRNIAVKGHRNNPASRQEQRNGDPRGTMKEQRRNTIAQNAPRERDERAEGSGASNDKDQHQISVRNSAPLSRLGRPIQEPSLQQSSRPEAACSECGISKKRLFEQWKSRPSYFQKFLIENSEYVRDLFTKESAQASQLCTVLFSILDDYLDSQGKSLEIKDATPMRDPRKRRQAIRPENEGPNSGPKRRRSPSPPRRHERSAHAPRGRTVRRMETTAASEPQPQGTKRKRGRSLVGSNKRSSNRAVERITESAATNTSDTPPPARNKRKRSPSPPGANGQRAQKSRRGLGAGKTVPGYINPRTGLPYTGRAAAKRRTSNSPLEKKASKGKRITQPSKEPAPSMGLEVQMSIAEKVKNRRGVRAPEPSIEAPRTKRDAPQQNRVAKPIRRVLDDSDDGDGLVYMGEKSKPNNEGQQTERDAPQQRRAARPIRRVLDDSDDSDGMVYKDENYRNKLGVPRKEVYMSGALTAGDAITGQDVVSNEANQAKIRQKRADRSEIEILRPGRAMGAFRKELQKEEHITVRREDLQKHRKESKETMPRSAREESDVLPSIEDAPQTPAAQAPRVPAGNRTIITGSYGQPEGQYMSYPAPPHLVQASLQQGPGRGVWRLYEEEKAIKHMLDIRDEGQLTGENRFREVSARLKKEGVERVVLAVKNYWNRYGRARSGFDERKNKRAPLATSKQGKKAKAQNLLNQIAQGEPATGTSSNTATKRKIGRQQAWDDEMSDEDSVHVGGSDSEEEYLP